jgi:hypothetical protein
MKAGNTNKEIQNSTDLSEASLNTPKPAGKRPKRAKVAKGAKGDVAKKKKKTVKTGEKAQNLPAQTAISNNTTIHTNSQFAESKTHDVAEHQPLAGSLDGINDLDAQASTPTLSPKPDAVTSSEQVRKLIEHFDTVLVFFEATMNQLIQQVRRELCLPDHKDSKP